MNLLKSITAGFAGALAINLLHETMRRVDAEAPRIDLLGGEAVSVVSRSLNFQEPDTDNLYPIALAGDIISNTAYYTMIGMGGKKGVFLRATVLGLSAGLGAVKLPQPLGLHDEPVASSAKKSLMTIGYYLFGALVTAATLKLISKK